MLNVQESAMWGAFPDFVTEIFCKIESKFLNSRVLAGGFVMGCAKSFGFKHFVMGCAKKSWF